MEESTQAYTYWVHDLDPVLIPLWGDIGIRYYGLAYLLGFIIGAILLRVFYRKGKSPLNPEQLEYAAFVLVLCILLGGRIGYVLLYRPDMLLEPWSIVAVWQGGMASHGGFVGVLVGCWLIAWKFRITLMRLMDLMSVLGPIGLLLGRIANFINGELWGKPIESHVPWAVIFPQSGTMDPRHPSQLYEAALEGAFLMVYMQWRFWRGGASDRPGLLTGEFLVIYAIVRVFCEQFREPDAGVAPILGLQRGIFYSLFLFVIGIAFIIRAFVRPPEPLHASTGETMGKGKPGASTKK